MAQSHQEALDISTERSELTHRFLEVLIERLSLDIEPEDVAEDSPLFGAGLGLDSVDALEIAVAIETEFGCEVTDEDMQVFRSVNTVVDFIQADKANSEMEDA